MAVAAAGRVNVDLPSSQLGLERAARGAPASVVSAIRHAAERVGVDFRALLDTARLESGFNPSARAATSSATGLFQFIDRTWLETLARHGPRHGLHPASRAEALALRRDPVVASLMAAEHMADNRDRLSAALGRAVDEVDLYLAHFLGVGGATRFLSELVRAPQRAGAELLPEAARANRSIFFARDGGSRSLADIRQLFERRLGGNPVPPASLAGRPEPAVPPSGMPARLAAQLAMADGARGEASRLQGVAPLALGLAAALDGAARPAFQPALLARLVRAGLGG